MALTPPIKYPQSSQQQEELDDAADYFMEYIAVELVPGMIEFIGQLNNFATSATSTSEITISPGNKNLVVETDKGFLNGMALRCAARDDPENWFQGVLISYNSSTGDLVMSSKQREGSGTYANWVISSATSPESLGMGEAVASAASPDIWLNDGNKRHITGTADINGFAEAGIAGALQWLYFEDAVKITQGANLILGRANYTTAPGDWAAVIAETTTKFRVVLFRVDGKAGVTTITAADIPNSTIRRSHVDSSVTRKVVSFGNRVGSDIMWPYAAVQLEDSSLCVWGRSGGYTMGIGPTGDVVVSQPSKPSFSPPIPSGQTIVKFAKCGIAMYAVLSNGWVYSTGTNTYGMLGHGDTTNRYVMKRIEYFVNNGISITNVWCESARITYPAGYVYFMNAAGQLWTCGYNGSGTLGLGDTSTRTTPVAVSSIADVEEVTLTPGSEGCAFLLKTDGTVYAVGNNANGQLGLGDNVNKTGFTLVPGFGVLPIKKVASSSGVNSTSSPVYAAHSMILTDSGDVYTAGANNYGQLGQGDNVARNTFTKIAALANIVDIGCCGGYYGNSWALSSTGRLYTWGYNASGFCGDGTVVSRSTPYNVAQYQTLDGSTATTVASDPPFVGLNGSALKIAKIANTHAGVGYSAMYVLDTDGKIWLSGSEQTAATGLANGTRNRFTPVLTPGYTVDGEKIIDISIVGWDNNQTLLAISDQKILYASGQNNYQVASCAYSAANDIVSLQRVVL